MATVSFSQLNPKPLVLAIRALIAGGLAVGGVIPARAELPVPTDTVTLSKTPVDIATTGHALTSIDGHQMTIDQTTDKATIDWNSFNIDAGSKVRFEQLSSTSVALNNIHQADASHILGTLTANGQVYLVNQNGFLFGPNSQVNVNSLVATTLGISDATFQNGITNAFTKDGSAALQGNGEIYLRDSHGNYLLDQHGQKIKIQIMIDQGAQISTNASNGRIIIAAPVVTNAGTVKSPNGQTILVAAEDKVYLQEADSSSNIRGLLVEVGTGGQVNNTGTVMAELGNASLMGFAVNQEGTVSATTSVNLNGSVRLLAREGIQDPTATAGKLLPRSTVRVTDLNDGLGTQATVNLGAGSVTSVELDANKSLTAIDAQAQSRSSIEISGHDVYLHNQSLVKAKSGNIDISALDDPTDSTVKGNARIFLEKGSKIDASGVKDIPLAMANNTVKVQLLSNELRDAPLQKKGVLYGQTVSVDVRDATLKYDSSGKLTSASIPIADISGAINRIARNIDERSTSGGTVNLQSTGDVITQTGSVIDFSGGSVDYLSGYLETTKLLSNGQLFDIATADPNRHYDSIATSVKTYESGYVQGKAGGSLNISTFEALLNGDLKGATVNGVLQRSVADFAVGSTLSINLSNNSTLDQQAVNFTNGNTQSDIKFTQSLPRESTSSSNPVALNLDAGLFGRSGITNVNLTTNGTINLQKNAQLDLPVKGHLNLLASGFDIEGAITAPSGTVNLNPVSISGQLSSAAITLGSSASIDVSGLWVNDLLDGKQGAVLSSAISSNGGSVTLTAEQGNLTITKGSRIDVSGSALLNAQGQVSAGQAGTINLTAVSHQAGGSTSSLILDGTLAGWGLTQGGKLNLNTSEVIIGSASNVPSHSGAAITPLVLDPTFFQQGGFANYQVTSNLYGLQVANNVKLTVQEKNLQLSSQALSQATGSQLESFSQAVTLPEIQQSATGLTLSFSELVSQNRQEALTIGQGAVIQTAANGKVELDSDTSVFVDGTINTPGGSIVININTPISGDTGFFASQGIWLGAQSRLLAQGAFVSGYNSYGLTTGNVLSGGFINLIANRGYIVSRAGASIDVSGITHKLDFQQSNGSVLSENIASNGGSIGLTAAEGMLVDGQMLANAGDSTVAGGSLSVNLSPNLRNKPLQPITGGEFPDDINPLLPRTIVISANNSASIPNHLIEGGSIDANSFSGQAFFNSNQLNNAHFDSLLFKTDVFNANGNYAGQVSFNGNVQLNARHQIVLDTSTIQTGKNQVTLNTAYAALGSTQSRVDTDLGNGQFSTTLAPDAITGLGKLTVNANGIDLVGGLSFSGINQVNLNSQGDVRTIGMQSTEATKNYLGQFNLAGNLNVTASQLYPATLTNYTFTVGGSGVVTIQNNGNTPAPIYSAGGSLTINATDILQKGTIKAPFGSLALNASNELMLASGSLTSVSGDGLTVLFGQGSGGKWLYPMDSSGATNLVITSPPQKSISLSGKNVALNTGAKVDLSGGGNLYAYEFITGPGGSTDVLDPNSAGYVQQFAVIPHLGNALTPYDPLQFSSSGLSIGESIYLGAGSGLAAGWYTLLPAHYALLPGAYLITPQAGTQSLQPGQTITNLADTTIVAGRYGVASAGTANSNWQGFAVELGSIARTRSQYTDYSANTFFSAAQQANSAIISALPRDAGSLAISAQTELTLGADLVATPDIKGQGGQVDISANNLAIVGTAKELAASGSGTVSLLASDLNKLNAPSLLLGGIRTKIQNGQRVSVTAQNLTIASDAKLQGNELLLAAENNLLIKSGAVVASSGNVSTNTGNLYVSNNGQTSSDGALVRVSSSGQANIIRDQTVTGQTGTLTVEAGAHLQSSASMLLDSTLNTNFKGSIDMNGGSLALIASKISLGAAPANTSGLVLSTTPSNLDILQLTSASGIDIFGNVGIKTGLLNIDAAQINGFDNVGNTATLTAKIIELTNTASIASKNGTGTGTLTLNTDQIQLGSGQYGITGFSQVNLNATTVLKGLGQVLDSVTGQSSLLPSGQLTVAGNLNLNAGHFIGDAGATTAINASGYQVAISSPGSVNSNWSSGLGASWSITGDTITSSGRVDLPSGILKLTALKGNIDFNKGSNIDVSGRVINFADIVKASSAGTVSLTANKGNINLFSGASINLASANSTKGVQLSDVGLLTINLPQGQFNWDGNITGLANSQADQALNQGVFKLYENTLGVSDFSTLNSKIATAGFNDKLVFELYNGNINIAATDVVKAHKIQLLADNGKVDIAGTINANGNQSGLVSIYGRDGITLASNGKIEAMTSATGVAGGVVTLDTVHRNDTGSGLLDLSQTGGVINVTGASSGFIHLRTGRNDTSGTVNVTDIYTHMIGADTNRVVLEATRVYDGLSAIDANQIASFNNDTNQFMSAAPKLVNHSGTAIDLLPGIEVRSSGDMTLVDPWDFMSWRYSDANGNNVLPGFLTLRAAGTLNINASLSDAFATAYLPSQSNQQFQNVLQPGLSWSYSLIVGNDINLANSYQSLDPYGSGQLVSTQVMVRTGTGSIDMQAGGNINYVADPNNPTAAAAVYTMGTTAQYTLTQLLSGQVLGVPARLPNESDGAYLNRLDPKQLNTLLRYGYFQETLLGLKFIVAEYPTQGGSINLQAGENITGINTGQQINSWLVRSGVLFQNQQATAWGINISGDGTNQNNGIDVQNNYFFNQNLGALGGGNVTVEAGGNIADLSVMLPTTGKPFGQLDSSAKYWVQTGTVINGGGNLQMTAGNNIVGGEYYVGLGSGNLKAGGSVMSSTNNYNLGALLELGDGSFNVQARQDVVIGSVFNPTLLPENNLQPQAAGSNSSFFTYSDTSAINLTATAGNVVLQNDINNIMTSKSIDTSTTSGFEYQVYPGILRVAALSSDIRIDNSMTLMPSAKGKLQLLANRNVGADANAAQIISINMSDTNPSLLPGINSATLQTEGSLADGIIRVQELLNPTTPQPTLIHASVPIHTGDTSKPSIIAKLGNIAFSSNSQVTFYLPQAAEFIAGQDINNLGLSGQNLVTNDVTLIKAGGNINFDALIDSNGNVQTNDRQIELGGPGQLQVQAGGNINLGSSSGINTIGNTKNTVLSSATGASINLLTGVSGQANYAGFINKYFTLGSDYLNNLVITDNQGLNLVAKLTPAQKLAYLLNLPDALKQPILLKALFNEIKLSSSAAAAAPQSQRKALYQQGFDAIAALFPGNNYQGDLSLVFSQIKSIAGGDINLLVPGGTVNVGLAGTMAGISKTADQLGIVAQSLGDVNAISKGDFNVNQSRVFTMGGGDIAIWSSTGNVDAGKGAKSAISAPAPITSLDSNGNVITTFPPIVSGSGIQTINPQDSSLKQGNVYLAAPAGVVDAGEAGISGGKVVIAATAVVGASNISSSSGSVGIPTAVAPPVVPSGAATATASVAKSATQTNDDNESNNSQSDAKKPTTSMLSADVISYGRCSVTDVREGKSGCGT